MISKRNKIKPVHGWRPSLGGWKFRGSFRTTAGRDADIYSRGEKLKIYNGESHGIIVIKDLKNKMRASPNYIYPNTEAYKFYRSLPEFQDL
jgi:hypothetical protein